MFPILGDFIGVNVEAPSNHFGVLLIENNQQAISSVRQIISVIPDSDLKVISTAEVALQNKSGWEPDLILFSHATSGYESFLPPLLRRYPVAYILCSLPTSDKQLVANYIQAGANGIVVKNDNYLVDLIHAIKTALMRVMDRKSHLAESFSRSRLFEEDGEESVLSLISGSLEPGQSILHYKIIEEIGEGGMGEVYRAEDLKLGRQVAIKVLPPKIARDAKMKSRLAHEARAASALNHPNIVTIHSIEDDAGLTFIVMEYVEGTSLQAILQEGPVEFVRVLNFGRQTAEALDAAHRIGIIHRDIKPANIMITGKDHVKLLDFGLATRVLKEAQEEPFQNRRSDQSGIEGRAGTVLYMSPEQTRGVKLDERSDIFSLGCVLYQAVTGVLPFNGSSFIEIMDAIAKAETPAPSSLNHSVPAAFDRLIQRTLAKNKEDRFSSADEVADELTRFQNQAFSRSGETVPEVRGGGTARSFLVTDWFYSHRFFLGMGVIFIILAFTFLSAQKEIPSRRTVIAAGQKIESVAVLPMVNLSGNQDEEYLADGLTESLIAHLAKIRELKVISRTSVMHYKGTSKSIPQIAKELKVDAIVEGSILRIGRRAKITAQLIHAQSDTHLWAENYERDFKDFLALQEELSSGIARGIQTHTLSGVQKSVTANRPVNGQAFEAYLKGRYQWNLRTKEALEKSVEYFHDAIEIDPGYSIAYSALADALQVMGSMGYLSPDGYLKAAREAAEKAVALDGNLAEAHASLGAIHAHEWRWTEARMEYEKAMKLNPNYATVHHWYSMLYLALNNCDGSLSEIRKARDLDPISFIINLTLGHTLSHCGRSSEALLQFEKTKEINPDHISLFHGVASAHERLGNFVEASEAYERAWLKEGMSREKAAQRKIALRQAYANSGARGYWRALLDMQDEPLSQKSQATYHALLGNIDEAFVCLEKGFQKHESDMFTIQFWPELQSIRNDPRYTDLVRRMGFS